jgi:nucleoside 2-deoxyribosyltransferase
MASRVFIAFAIEDAYARDFLKNQAGAEYEYVDMSVKEPWDSEWKTKCRSRIRGCAGVVALLSSNTTNAEGALWEIGCAIEEGKPLLGVYISKDDKVKPSVMTGETVIEWSRQGIKDFIDGL